MAKTALKDLTVELLPARTTMREVRVNVRVRTAEASNDGKLINSRCAF